MSTDRAASSQTVRDFRQLVYVKLSLKRDSQYPRLTDLSSILPLRDRHLSLDTVLDIKHVLDMPYVDLSMAMISPLVNHLHVAVKDHCIRKLIQVAPWLFQRMVNQRSPIPKVGGGRG